MFQLTTAGHIPSLGSMTHEDCIQHPVKLLGNAARRLVASTSDPPVGVVALQRCLNGRSLRLTNAYVIVSKA